MMSSFMQPQYLWAIVGILLLLAELGIPGLIIFFFGLGALLTSVVLFVVPLGLNQQLVLFLVSSLLMLVGLRRWLKNVFTGFIANKQNLEVNADGDFTGKTVVVLEAIAPGRDGKVELNGTDWRAASDESLAPGERVTVTRQDNLTLFVKGQA
ncbi:MAG: NfeD family protein [Kiritimatiellae bacterium]|nr:NfeD family protein [Kiritimatiellia bacterium]